MNVIETYTGMTVNPLALRPEDVNLPDIAHSLSLVCRFAGHCNRFYSVAQHSVLCLEAYRNLYMSSDREIARREMIAVLLHDAAEAYLGDFPRPVKGAFSAVVDGELVSVKEIENRTLATIGAAFGVDLGMSPVVKLIDDRMGITEGKTLMSMGEAWDEFDAEPLDMEIVSWAPEMAEMQFYREAAALDLCVSPSPPALAIA